MQNNLHDINEEFMELRDASFFLNNATRTFIEDINSGGSYNDNLSTRTVRGLYSIHAMLDKEYGLLHTKIWEEVQNGK